MANLKINDNYTKAICTINCLMKDEESVDFLLLDISDGTVLALLSKNNFYLNISPDCSLPYRRFMDLQYRELTLYH